GRKTHTIRLLKDNLIRPPEPRCSFNYSQHTHAALIREIECSTHVPLANYAGACLPFMNYSESTSLTNLYRSSKNTDHHGTVRNGHAASESKVHLGGRNSGGGEDAFLYEGQK
ncbi:hypothetical protein BaRGS_00007038, partial [Batillaria attramentaria]